MGLAKVVLSSFVLCLELSKLAQISPLISQPVTSQKWLSHFAKQLFQGLLDGREKKSSMGEMIEIKD